MNQLKLSFVVCLALLLCNFGNCNSITSSGADGAETVSMEIGRDPTQGGVMAFSAEVTFTSWDQFHGVIVGCVPTGDDFSFEADDEGFSYSIQCSNAAGCAKDGLANADVNNQVKKGTIQTSNGEMLFSFSTIENSIFSSVTKNPNNPDFTYHFYTEIDGITWGDLYPCDFSTARMVCVQSEGIQYTSTVINSGNAAFTKSEVGPAIETIDDTEDDDKSFGSFPKRIFAGTLALLAYIIF